MSAVSQTAVFEARAGHPAHAVRQPRCVPPTGSMRRNSRQNRQKGQSFRGIFLRRPPRFSCVSFPLFRFAVKPLTSRFAVPKNRFPCVVILRFERLLGFSGGWRWFLSSRRMRPSLFSSIPVPSSSPPRRNQWMDCAGHRLIIESAEASPLAVAGCLVGRYHAEDLAPELPEVDLWLDNSDLKAWPAMLARKRGLPEPTVPGRILSTGPSYAWLKISDGCRHACSFCAIPNIRGGHRLTADMIVREARALLDQGQGTESRGAGSHGMGV